MGARMKLGDRVKIASKKKTRHNGKTGRIVAKEGAYYRVEKIDGLHPATSYLYKEHELEAA